MPVSYCFDYFVVVVQSLSCVRLFAIPWTRACQAHLSFSISKSLLKFMSIESVMLPNHLILCCPLLLLPSIFPSIRAFSNESAVNFKWSKYWNFSISSSNEYSRLISFRIDWFDLLAVQGTLKNLLQHHNSKVSVFQHSAFFIVLTIPTFVSNVMPLLFNMVSRFVIAFFPRSKHLLISWL